MKWFPVDAPQPDRLKILSRRESLLIMAFLVYFADSREMDDLALDEMHVLLEEFDSALADRRAETAGSTADAAQIRSDSQ